MFIFLDESYNLFDRTKPQFVSINGFRTALTKPLWKRWKDYRLPYVSKARIHASEHRFEPLRDKCLHLLYHHRESMLLTVKQDIATIPLAYPSPYRYKDKLNFEKVYEDMLKALLDALPLHDFKRVSITADQYKHQGGRLGKKQFREAILAYLQAKYPGTFFDFELQYSTANILLEIADFVSNSFYKRYTGERIEMLEKFEAKTIAIKNPL